MYTIITQNSKVFIRAIRLSDDIHKNQRLFNFLYTFTIEIKKKYYDTNPRINFINEFLSNRKTYI